jgi:uncharacterized membrane protein YfhO
VQWVSTPDEEIRETQNANTKNTAIIHEEFRNAVGSISTGAPGDIRLSSYSPNRMVYTAEATASQLAVFSEVWYGPDLGWKIYIDGTEAPLIRANYVLRAAVIPEGKHEIVMEFKPRSFALGKTLSTLCSAMLLGLLGFAAFRQWKPNPAESA